MIEARDVSVCFTSGGRIIDAVKRASFKVNEGEAFGIVGSSGAGKSTLLRTLNLLQRPVSGSIVFDGIDITYARGEELRKVRLRVGMIFQHFNLMRTRTVFDNIAFAMKAAGKSVGEIRKRVPELLAIVGLEDKSGAYPSRLSGGQKQRVGIARALANDPELLLCDEPTSALDPETQDQILQLIREINKKTGISVVIISHEMAVIKAVCDRVAVMDDGVIVEEGFAYEIFAHPKHAFTKRLVDRTFDLQLPQRLLKDARGTLFKLIFLGDGAEKAVISDAIKRFDVAINVLHGKIEYIGDSPIGVLIVSISGEENKIGAVVEYFRSVGVGTEEVHE